MFSYSGLNAMQVDQLKNDHSIYIVGSGRINVAGLNSGNVEQLCEAILEVLLGLWGKLVSLIILTIGIGIWQAEVAE